MVGRPRVAADADVPVADARGALAGSGLHRGGCPSEGVEQRDEVLLVQGSLTQVAHPDVERAVLPDHVVLQQGVRESLARWVVQLGR